MPKNRLSNPADWTLAAADATTISRAFDPATGFVPYRLSLSFSAITMAADRAVTSAISGGVGHRGAVTASAASAVAPQRTEAASAPAPAVTTAAISGPSLVASVPPPQILPTAPTAAQLNNITFLTGVDANSTVVGFQKDSKGAVTGVGIDGFGVQGGGKTFYTWDSNNPATYTPFFPFGTKSVVFAGKFAAGGASSSAVGSAGGAQAYYFDPASNWTSAEQVDLRSALELWSAVANITFTQTTTQSAASIIFHRNNGGGDNASYTGQQFTFAGGSTLGSRTAAGAVTINIDTSPASAGVGVLGDFFTAGGYGVQKVIHEVAHAIGLGHPDPYNDGTGPGAFVLNGPNSNQLSPYNSLLWSGQSYVQPNDTTANQYPNYAVKNANWNGSYNITWRPDDILAALRLYGAQTSGPLSGGQVFGYNTNITGDLKQYFDFTRYDSPSNTTKIVPVVTLYDTGTNNTLDLSGTSTNTIINLLPGNFSSYDNAIDNIAIAYGTRIDIAKGGTGANQYVINGDGDTIFGQGTNNTVYYQTASTASVIKRVSATQVTVTTGTVVDTLNDVQTGVFTDKTINFATLPCFAAGTRILTTRGEIAVEDLVAGDDVIAERDGLRAAAPIVWIGERRGDIAAHPRPDHVRPVRIAPGALADGVPRRALLVSPDHAMLVDGHLVPARLLLNGATVTQVDVPSVHYFHIELARHAILWAEGAPAESFLDTGNRSAFANAPVVAARPDFARADHPDACAPLVTDPAIVAPVWHRIAARAGVTAPVIATGEARVALHLADGRRIAAAKILAGGRHIFRIDGASGPALLRSAHAAPAHLRPWLDDRRELGVAASAITLWTLDHGLEPRTIDLGSPALSEGWWPVEQDGGHSWRWTDGAATIQLPPSTIRLDVTITAPSAGQPAAIVANLQPARAG